MYIYICIVYINIYVYITAAIYIVPCKLPYKGAKVSLHVQSNSDG